MNQVLAECLVSMVALALTYRLGFVRLRRDEFRSRIRRIRDRLFDFMWKHQLSYEDPVYQETRQMLNGIIRMSRTLTPLNFLVEGYFAARQGTLTPLLLSLKERMEHAPDTEFGREIEHVHTEALRALVDFVFCQGVFGMCLRCLLAIVWFEQWVMRTAKYQMQRAYLAGRPGLSANGLTNMLICH